MQSLAHLSRRNLGRSAMLSGSIQRDSGVKRKGVSNRIFNVTLTENHRQLISTAACFPCMTKSTVPTEEKKIYLHVSRRSYHARSDYHHESYEQSTLLRLLDPEIQFDLSDTQLWNQAEESLQWLVSHQRRHPVKQTERIRNSIRLLDRMASSLPKDASSFNQSLIDGPVFWGILPTDILNDTLSLWKRQLLRRNNNASLPSPSRMAEKVEQYRWKCLVQPDATSFNLLLHAMVQTEGVAAADAYLRRLLQVAAKQHSLVKLSNEEVQPMVDVVSVATVMQGWANDYNADKAQEWLDRMNGESIKLDEVGKQLSTLNIQPNTLAYTFVIHGWAQQGNGDKAQVVLEQLLNATEHNGAEELLPDRILFHTVLDAWSKATEPRDRDKVAPLKAKELVHLMEDTARKMGDADANEVRPNMETYGKLIAVYARSNTRKYGAQTAENLLMQTEDELEETASIVVVNRILQGYIDYGQMDKAEDLLNRRAEQLEHIGVGVPRSCCPDEATLNIFLSGFVKDAKKDPDAPERAQEMVDRFVNEFDVRPSIQSYSILLNTWSACARQREDAAQKAEEMLLKEVLDLYHDGSSRSSNDPSKDGITPHKRHFRSNRVDDFTICVNIVLKTWSFQAGNDKQSAKGRAMSQQAVERALLLLSEFLENSDDEMSDPSQSLGDFYNHSERKSLRDATAKPTDGTFRAVLHAILDSSISHKRERAEVILTLMKRHRCHPNKTDLKRIKRLSNGSAK